MDIMQVGLKSHKTMRVSVLFPKFVLQVWKCWSLDVSSIFVSYFVNSKRYVFISENEDRSMTEVEFRNAIFIEKDFPIRGSLMYSETIRENDG